MDIVFMDTQQGTPAISDPSSTTYVQLHTLLHQAIHRATLLERDILASFTYSIASYDPLHVFRTFAVVHAGERIYWEQPAEQKAFVGVGRAVTIETAGPERFSAAAKQWQGLQVDAMQESSSPELTPRGLVLFGGFAFDPLRPRTTLWRDFPDGLLILPELLFSASSDTNTLTINLLVKPTDEHSQITERVSAMLQTVELALRQSPPAESDQETPPNERTNIQDILPAQTWKDLVAQTVAMIRQEGYKKVMLARSVQASSPTTFPIASVLQRLHASYPGAYVFALQQETRFFVGATPERLLQAQDGQIQTMALAGSAPRGRDAAEDARLGSELMHSAKNQEEHAIVVSTIREALSQSCAEVWVADTPQLLRLKNIQHLETPIVGKLLPGQSVLKVIQNLHPTPAVGGFPREAALEILRDYEGLDRGWFAGPVGWVDANGNGEFAVALRSALLDGAQATLFAGCGIVADSNPESEYAESCLKLKVMLRGLGVEE